MNLAMKVLIDHREHCQDRKINCCKEELFIKIKVGLMSEYGLLISNTEDDDSNNNNNEG